jgi:uncharacterized protein (DUF924 family)
MTIATPRDVLDFWFKETKPEAWFKSDPAFDAAIKARFEETWRAARDGQLASWEESKDGALALLLVLDQFPRNMFRGQADSFATDQRARGVAERALARGYDLEAPVPVRNFFYLPFMHSEDLADQERSVALARERLGETHFSYPFALNHRAVIERFGRFPARNRALGRATTPEEAAFLQANPAGF